MTKCRYLLFSVLGLLMLEPAFAQSISHDGNRWYEIEISIFTNRNINSLNKELNLQDRVSLYYPDDILQLSASADSYAYDFSSDRSSTESSDRSSTESSNRSSTESSNRSSIESSENPVMNGPQYSPAQNSFRVSDSKTGSFIALGPEHQKFLRNNQKISNSSEHRLLYHAVWRQPVLNKVQSKAIFIHGGDRYGEHNELEGSITLSYNINRVDIDTMLWLNSFMVKIDNETSLPLPLQAFPLPVENDRFGFYANEYFVEDISFMKEIRQMRSNELHYLDHPAFGLLIQIRPYDLPLSSDFEQ